MEAITYSNISVTGFPFTKLLNVKIQHLPNEHAVAEIVGELEADQAQYYTNRVDETTMVTVSTTAEGQKEKLFCGYVSKLELQQVTEYNTVCLQLESTSCLTDINKINKTYQDTNKTYGQIISNNFGSTADLHMIVSDRAIGALIMQYNETDWEFAKRMASQLGAPLITNLSSSRSQIYMGLPPSSKTVTLDSSSYTYGSNIGIMVRTNGSLAEDFSSGQVQSYEYAYLGDQVIFNGTLSYIQSVRAVLIDGVMEMTYGLLSTGVAAGASSGKRLAGIAVPRTQNTHASGKMMKGVVKQVRGDQVQVFLNSVDSSYDDSGNWWFPYSTAYSSSDGSGWYCMPEVGDEVMVFFPSGSEGQAFAASSVCSSPPANPRNKSWKAPGGKEILLTDEGMYIIAKSGKIFINLTDEKGVEIHSDKDINISSEANIRITSCSEVHVVAENQIVVGTEDAYLELSEGNATLAASQVLIN